MNTQDVGSPDALAMLSNNSHNNSRSNSVEKSAMIRSSGVKRESNGGQQVSDVYLSFVALSKLFKCIISNLLRCTI